MRLIECGRSGEVATTLGKYNSHPLVAITRYILAGFIANRQEFAIWRSVGGKPLMPTLFSFGGFLTIQRRGEPVSADELMAEHPFRGSLESCGPDVLIDLLKAENFCRYEGSIRLLDYGGLWAPEFFPRRPAVGIPIAYPLRP